MDRIRSELLVRCAGTGSFGVPSSLPSISNNHIVHNKELCMYEVDGVWMVIGITGNVQCHFTIGIEHEWAQKEKVTLTTLLLEEGLG